MNNVLTQKKDQDMMIKKYERDDERKCKNQTIIICELASPHNEENFISSIKMAPKQCLIIVEGDMRCAL